MKHTEQRPPVHEKPRRPLPVRITLVAVGSISLALGIAGIFLPILPTTPFLIIAGASYARSSERLYTWLTTNRLTGAHMRRIVEGKGISHRAKVVILAFAWVVLILAAVFVAKSVVMRIVFPAIAVVKTFVFVAVVPTARDEKSLL